MAAPPSSPHPAVVIDVLVEQFLLRLPPEDPADLARAALVSKQWHSVVTGAIFRRTYREFHRSPPLLGYMLNPADSTRFVSMSSSFRLRQPQRRDVEAIHSSHGRVLLRSTRDKELDDLYLSVWHPIKNKEWKLPVLLSTLPGSWISNWDAAVVCAVGDGCSHLDCHFKVVVVGKSGGRMFSCFYSSEADSWSDRTFDSVDSICLSKMGSVLIGNTLYFRRGSSLLGEMIIKKYDLLTHQMCTITRQCGFEDYMNAVLIATEDGKLGVANISNSTLSLCLMEQGRWVVGRVSQLRTLLPPEALVDEPVVAAFANTGAGGVIFVRTRVGFFTIDLNSGRCKKLGEGLGSVHIVPYMSFCSPAPGTVSTDVGQGATVVASTHDEPAAGVAVSRDEGPGDGIVVSTDEGPGPSMLSA